MNISRLLCLGVILALGLTTRLSAQLSWSVSDETTITPVNNTTDSFSVTIPAGKRATLIATNFVPIDWSSGAKDEVYVTLNFKASGGLSSIGAGTRAVGFGLYNNNGTSDDFSDDKGYFTWLNGRATGSLIELRRRNGDGTSPSLLNPSGTAYNGLGTGTKTFTSGALTDAGSYAIQMHLMARAPGVSFGNTSSTTTGAGIWVSGDGLSQTAYTNADNPPATLVFNQVGFMFYNSTASDVTLTINSITGLTAVNPPSVSTQPASLSLNPGQSNALTVLAKGTAPLSYQWKKDGAVVSGATSASLALGNVSNADAGSYVVTITNAYGTVSSSAATVTVSAASIPATFTSQPASLTVAADQSASFSATSYGSDPVTYQWKKDGSVIAGASSPSFTIDKVAVSDAGNYTVTITNSAGSATSTAAVLTVNSPPVIVTQPVGATVAAGQNVTFTVAATGSPSPTYQWQKNGVNIAGANAASLSINGVTLADTGTYTVRIVNSIGAVSSAAAVLAIPSTMTATAFSPAAGTTKVNTDTVLRVTFDQVPVIGNTGRIRIYDASDNSLVDTIDMGVTPYTRDIGTQTVKYIFYPIIVSGNTATIYPHAGVLGYGKTYYVTLEQGIVRDSTGASFTGLTTPNTWTFSTKASGPAADATALTVAADGSGDFNTVQGAVDFVPLNNTQRVVITVKKGTYTEMVYVGAAKPFITIQGEDRAQTIIQYANNANFNTLTGNNRALFGCDANDFILQTITLRNLTPKGGSQAEAFRTGSLRVALNRVSLYSFQDTFMANGTNCTAFVTDSYLEGDTDFMWGQASVYFQRCELKAVNPGFYVQARNPQTSKGFVYVDCKLTGTAAAAGTFLARADPTPGNFPYSQVVYINCAMDTHIPAAGWKLDNATTSSTVQFWEYKSTDLNGALLDVSSRLSSSKQIDAATAVQYRDPSFVLGGWAPAFAPTIEVAPASQTVDVFANVTMSVVANGAPQPTLQWYKDGVAIAGATGTTLSIASAPVSASGSYTVVATNSLGSVTSTAAVLQVAHGKYFGSYFGTLGTGGSFALYLRDAGTGVFLGKDASGAVYVSHTVSVDSLGRVSANVGSSSAASLSLSATIGTTGALSGSLVGKSSTLGVSGARSANLGSSLNYAGYFQVSAVGSSSTVNMILGAGGQAYVVTQVGAVFDAGSGTVNGTGYVTATTSNNRTVTGLLSSNASTSLAIINDNQGNQVALSGGADSASSAQRFQAFSVRARANTGDNVIILGFILTGTEPNDVLLIAVGPSLTGMGSTGGLSAPKIDLYKSGALIATNTNWNTASNKDALVSGSAAMGGSPLTAANADSAIRMALAPGAYTAIVRAADDKAGIAVVEVFDMSMGSKQRLADLSARAPTGSFENTLIGGVVVSGNTPKRMLIRGIGPSLAQAGLSGVLAKPVLSLYQNGRLIAQNNGVANSADATAIALATAESGAGALSSAGTDAVLLMNLAPGIYTAQLTSGDGGTGLGMIEIYELP
jgi:pectin methylesterase-like acyl-CoA thioesterase